MSKGTQTREMIIERAAPLFNQHGYFGASMADIMHETGMEKGGIYNHFASKEQLALEAFDYAFGRVQQRVRLALQGKTHAVERLQALLTAYQSIAEDPPVAGGCPVLNTAVEADDAQPALRERACDAMEQWCDTIRRIITKGIERQELRPEIDIAAFASVFTATIEGAIMLSRLYRDTSHMQHAVNHLNWYIETFLRL